MMDGREGYTIVQMVHGSGAEQKLTTFTSFPATKDRSGFEFSSAGIESYHILEQDM